MKNGRTSIDQLGVLWETTDSPEAYERVLSAFELLLADRDTPPRFDRTRDSEQYENKGPR